MVSGSALVKCSPSHTGYSSSSCDKRRMHMCGMYRRASSSEDGYGDNLNKIFKKRGGTGPGSWEYRLIHPGQLNN
ncbi:hypothetical protein ScPMuIL_014376 [Solemya velum]